MLDARCPVGGHSVHRPPRWRACGKGPPCGCGARGCWELYASSNAALRYYAESNPKTPANTINDLLRRISEDDPKAIAALNKQAEFIGQGLRTITASLAPEVILIAGDIVAGAWDRVCPIIEKSLSAASLTGLKPRLLPTHEAEVARLRGAAILALQRRSVSSETVQNKRVLRKVANTKRSPARAEREAVGAIAT